MLGASFCPNHAERTAIGLATTSAPSASRQPSGARNASAAAKPAEREQHHQQPVVVERRRQQAPDAPTCRSCRGSTRSAPAPPRARARARTRCRRACRSAPCPTRGSRGRRGSRRRAADRPPARSGRWSRWCETTGAVASRRPSWSRVDGSSSASDTASTSSAPAQAGQSRRRCSCQAPISATPSAARKHAARAMPTSHSSPAARTSGPRIPSGSTALRPERPRVRAQLGQRHREDGEQQLRAAPSPRARSSGRAGPGDRSRRGRGVSEVWPRAVHAVVDAGPGELARRHAEHHPGERVLEEAAVEQRVHEQAQEGGARAPAPSRARAASPPRSRALLPPAATCRAPGRSGPAPRPR